MIKNLLGALLAICLFASPVIAETVYVDNTTTSCSNGDIDYDPLNDTCGGGSFRIYDHPDGADNYVSAGDTVIVADGTYTDNDADDYVIDIDSAIGTAVNWITFKAENKWGAIIDGSGNTDKFGVLFGSNVDYIRLEDFEIKDVWGDGVLNNSGADYIYIYRNKIHDIGNICTDTTSGLNGITVGTGSSYCTIDSNLLYNVGRLRPGESGCSGLTTEYYENHDHGIYMRSSDHTIINNIFYDHDNGWPIQLYGGTQNNIYIINNTFADANPDRDGHILSSTGTETVYIENNISYNPTTAIIRNASCTANEDIQARNNLTNVGSLISGVSTCVTESNNYLSTDPGLTDEGSNDYTLISSSNAIDVGLNTNAPELDYAGNPRISNSIVDIGAYEFIGAPDPSTIIDNGDAETSFTGTWPVSGGADPYGTDSVWGETSYTYTWTFTASETGTHQVYLWWTFISSRSIDVAVDVEHAGGTANLTVNQQVNGGQWNLLGSYEFTATTAYDVVMTADASADESASADAVKFTPVSASTRRIFFIN